MQNPVCEVMQRAHWVTVREGGGAMTILPFQSTVNTKLNAGKEKSGKRLGPSWLSAWLA